eukprot:jgi/Tetstr1/430492/TSEL_020300.t1
MANPDGEPLSFDGAPAPSEHGKPAAAARSCFGLAGPAASAEQQTSTPPPSRLPPALRLRKASQTFSSLPAIYKRRKPGVPEDEALRKVQVPDWQSLKQGKAHTPRPSQDGSSRGEASLRQSVQKVTKVVKQKGAHAGRTFTSKYRGVHQTFPTRRWEAQFRRAGKPTSLGCFDHETEAARAYDKMMIWCELHQSASVKGGITNFDVSEYQDVIPTLRALEQDDLVMMLRRDGRTQAAHGSLAVKAANLRSGPRAEPGASRRTASLSVATTAHSGDEGADSRYQDARGESPP